MEDIAAAFARFLRFLAIDTLLTTIIYWIGWPVVKVLTLGRHPKRRWPRPLSLGLFDDDEGYVFVVGLAVVILAVWVMAR